MLDGAFVEAADASPYAGKTLVERATGRFYTPDVLSADLGRRVTAELERILRARACSEAVRLCDPFAGDGRLVEAVLVQAAASQVLKSRKWLVTLRDLDGEALAIARARVCETAASTGLDITVELQVGDSLTDSTPPMHDAVVTNPPWELLKPDSREVASLDDATAAAYKAWLKKRCQELDARFPNAKADVSWAGWGTNLARCGWDLALCSTRQGGVLGIVLPSTILGDQASASMRRSVIERARLLDLAAYPPEARLFERVDQPVVAATFIVEPSGRLDAVLRLFGADRAIRAERPLIRSREELASTDYALPVGFGAEAEGLLADFASLPRFKDLEGTGSAHLWAGRELDETGLAAKLVPQGEFRFLKGRMVQRHGFAEQPNSFVPTDLARGLRSVAFERVVWRDVSRSSQARRMIATVIPPGWVTGNSLHVVHFRDGDPQRLRALYAVMSSLVFEFQVRSRLATGHMSLGIVRNARVPKLHPQTLASLARVTDATLRAPDKEAELEVRVARAFGLDRERFAVLLEQFPKLQAKEREALLGKSLWKSRAR